MKQMAAPCSAARVRSPACELRKRDFSPLRGRLRVGRATCSASPAGRYRSAKPVHRRAAQPRPPSARPALRQISKALDAAVSSASGHRRDQPHRRAAHGLANPESHRVPAAPWPSLQGRFRTGLIRPGAWPRGVVSRERGPGRRAWLGRPGRVIRLPRVRRDCRNRRISAKSAVRRTRRRSPQAAELVGHDGGLIPSARRCLARSPPSRSTRLWPTPRRRRRWRPARPTRRIIGGASPPGASPGAPQPCQRTRGSSPPTSPLSGLADSGRKASTIGRRAAAIGCHHKMAGHEPLCCAASGARSAAPSRGKAPATADLIGQMIALCPGQHDRQAGPCVAVPALPGTFRRSDDPDSRIRLGAQTSQQLLERDIKRRLGQTGEGSIIGPSQTHFVAGSAGCVAASGAARPCYARAALNKYCRYDTLGL